MKSDFYETVPLDAAQIEIVRRMSHGEHRSKIASELDMTRKQVTHELQVARELVDAFNDAHLVAIVYRAGLLADEADAECDGQLPLFTVIGQEESP